MQDGQEGLVNAKFSQRRSIVIHTNLKFAAMVLLCLCTAAALAQQPDKEGFKDPALFTRMPNYWGDWVEEKEFAAQDFRASKDKDEHVEGHFLKYLYRFDNSRGAAASPLQVMRNYQNAAKRIGGKVLFENDELTTLLVTKDGKETWVSVEPYGEQITLVIVERQAMQQNVTADATALQGGLAQVGHVEVPGIFFDTNKSDLKPESKPALDEVAKLLKTNPSMRIWVVGHTDSVGSPESNVTLSNARAAAVIKALTQQMGIDPGRLAPHGAGPYSPVATNKTEEGRARNRRVELVER
jgi:outer membrane protein OmpA-like peptidoglycan-associated protein